ncbi:ComEC/Rec2 family competence protein [Novosphingobium sp. G106]|uniref:ComEC/Rec2 family competence protein n=1 Tax=Novosphingobium sp. G106 TaxID=2849500 RepID=UPI002811829F|nr:ComEC/Rec2 family competence protein [Novosphingobium sp. G106]
MAGFERGPWLAVAFAGGIAAWFALANRWEWLALLALCCAVALASLAGLRGNGLFPHLRQSLASLALLVGAGCIVVWAKSELAGARPIERPLVAEIAGVVLDREPRPAEGRVRLLLAMREPGSGRAIRVRVTVPIENDRPELSEGASVSLKARLMPPAPPMLPGAYDFARTAWFAGIAATGSALGPVKVTRPGEGGGWLERTQARLSGHVRQRLGGSAGAIATAFASGDRGAIAKEDDEAMRDAGLSHLLSISGLHVSAVVGAAYLVALRLLALWPWLALRVRLPLVAAGAGAGAGVFYTLLTGAEVPTVRSCIGAVLVLAALALGREPLSMRMVAVAAFFVLLFWPEAVVGPSFQMSFAAVIAIVALHGAAPVRAFLAPREEGWTIHLMRQLAMLLVTGVVIELAIMPIGLFHFHRAGIYGALANVVAIPLTTVVTMPLIALALALDLVGAGAPAWWLTGKSLDLMLALAHWVADQPGAVTTLPAMGRVSIALFVAGGLWLALWRGRARLWGLVPVLIATASLAAIRAPDVLVSGDGRHVGIVEANGDLLVLREQKSEFVRDNLTELAGMDGELRLLADWPGALCNRDFCVVTLSRGGRDWQFLIGRGHDPVAERELAAACDRVDIVISDRWLPNSCRPAILKADRRMLTRTGGLAIDLTRPGVTTVAETQGEHGWWQVAKPRPRPTIPSSAPPVKAPSSNSAAVGDMKPKEPVAPAKAGA